MAKSAGYWESADGGEVSLVDLLGGQTLHELILITAYLFVGSTFSERSDIP